MSSTLKLRFKVGNIEFEAEGYPEDVNVQRKEFEKILPGLLSNVSDSAQEDFSREMQEISPNEWSSATEQLETRSAC